MSTCTFVHIDNQLKHLSGRSNGFVRMISDGDNFDEIRPGLPRISVHASRAIKAILFLCCMYSCSLGAEETALPRPSPTTDDEVIILSPFEVNAANDDRYRATNSITGTRLDTSIKTLPMPIEVITGEFLRDTGSTGLRQSLRYSSGILLQSQNDQGTPGGYYQGPGGVNNPEGATANKSQTSIKIRGYVTDSVLRDGYRRQHATDSINISRIEVVRGPSALLYGIGNFGGIVNYLPKLPEPKQLSEATFSFGSYDFNRTTIDATGPISAVGHLNYRLTAAEQSTHDYTQYKKERHNFVSPVLAFKPTSSTQILLDYEYGKQWQQGIGFQRVRAAANVGVNSDQNERSGLYTLPGTNPRTFRWSGPDTKLDSKASNLRAQVIQRLHQNLNLLIGYNRSQVEFLQLDVQGNFAVNIGPPGLRSPIYVSSIDPENGDSNQNIINGTIPNAILQYAWTRASSQTDREQVRTELNYNLSLFPNSNHWFKINNVFLLGHSQERVGTDVFTEKTPDNQWNWKSPDDLSSLRFGTQGDGSPDLPMISHDANSSTGWNQGTYFVYQGQFLQNRVTVVSGLRRDRNSNAVTTHDYVADTVQSTRSPAKIQRTSQNGISIALTKSISIFALKAGGIQPNFSGERDTDGQPLGPILARSSEVGVKIDLFDGKISGTISSYRIKRTGTPNFYWWAPTSNYTNFDRNRPIIYNVANFSPSTVPGGSNGGNGATEAAIAQWNAGVASGAIYQKNVGGSTNWYVNASQPTGAAYLDAVFDYTKSHGMSWPGWLYNYDSETNNSWNDRASGPQGNENVVGSDSAKGWDTQLLFSPSANLQILTTYAHTRRQIDSAGQFSRSPNPQDRWAPWYFPNTDWGLTGLPLESVYSNPGDTSTWTGIGYGLGEKQDDTPEHQASTWINYRFKEGPLKGISTAIGGWWESSREYMSGITHGAGQRVTDRNGRLVTLSMPSRYNVDLMAAYTFKLLRREATVQINIYNLLNDQKEYGLLYAAPTSVRIEFRQTF